MNRLRAVGAAILAGAILLVPLFLHFTQKRHNVLPYRVEVAWPQDRALVGGEAFASTLAVLVEHELSSSTGWRPNDFFLWGPSVMADNNANRQLGILHVVRENTRVMRDHLTKVSASEYDPNLQEAETRLRNDERKFWFPSAESRFRDGVAALKRYVAGLESTPPRSKPINRRNVELIRLFQAWTDILGDAHSSLLRRDVGFFATDDHFYRAQGIAYALHHLTVAIHREYAPALAGRDTVNEVLTHVARSFAEAAAIKPVVVLDGRASGIFANHRRNLDAYLIDARQLLYTVREELEK
jgi:hypothetical protein